MDCRVIVAGCDPWVRGQIGEGFSHESEHDLALMVSDFLENGSSGTESWCSSDGDSCLSDLTQLAEKIPVSSSNTSLSLSLLGPHILFIFLIFERLPNIVQVCNCLNFLFIATVLQEPSGSI